MNNNIAIIGHGYVGQGYNKVFPGAYIYDEPKGIGVREEVNKCELAIVCTPTPMLEDGSCDTFIVEDVIRWIKTPLILIKSTIPPGTTDELKKKYNKRICFSPEYMGESNYWTSPWKYPSPTNPISHTFQIIGGDKKDAEEIIGVIIEKLGPEKFYYIVESKEAETIKYMQNTWGATKVSFCQEFYDLCQALDISYTKVREGLLLDSRIERMHTAVFPNKRKWGGKCWPKDIMAIIKVGDKVGCSMDLLKQVVIKNENKEVAENEMKG